MGRNVRYQFVLLYTVGWGRMVARGRGHQPGDRDGAFRIGEQAGLPLHRYRLEDTANAHAAVESRAVGKVLVTVGAS
jgi:NADPH2:quinone reductase